MNYERVALQQLFEGNLELLPHLNIKFFNKGLQKIYTRNNIYYEKYKKLPDYATMRLDIDNNAPNEYIDVLKALVDGIEKASFPKLDNNEIIGGLKDQLLLSTVDTYIDKLVESSGNRDMDAIRKTVNSIVETTALSELTASDLEDTLDEDETLTITPSPWKTYNEVCGGFCNLTLISGAPGSGKTISVVKSALDLYDNYNENVSLISIEMSEGMLAKRIKSFISKVPFGSILLNKTTAQQDKVIAEAKTRLFDNKKNVFKMLHAPIRADELLTLIRIQHDLYNIKTFFVDYITLVQAPLNSRAGADWQYLQRLIKDLHLLTQELGITIVSPIQVEVDEAKESSSGELIISARGSKEYYFSASVWVHLQVDAESGAVILHSVKNRIGLKKKVMLDPDFSVMDLKDTGVSL